MRIAQLSPLEYRTPPKKYGSLERVASALTEELVRRGHEVTLFASGDSVTAARLEATIPLNTTDAGITKFSGPYNPLLLRSVGRAYTMADQLDIIHHHTGGIGLPLAHLSTTPAVVTVHTPISEAFQPLYQEFKKPYIVAISRDQLQDHIKIGLHSAGAIHHGLPMEHYPFSKEYDNYLLYVGSIWHAKGTHIAIAVAKRLNLPLIIAAKLGADAPAQQYFKEIVEPQLGGNIQWIGEVTEEERNKLMSRTMAFLHPATWREPFGLTVIEAMACGAPVVAFNKGSMPELIEDGKTGFLVEDEDEMVEAIKKVETIDRTYTRAYALKNFSAKRMTDDYERLYKQILEKKSA